MLEGTDSGQLSSYDVTNVFGNLYRWDFKQLHFIPGEKNFPHELKPICLRAWELLAARVREVLTDVSWIVLC